jgi:CheY-like chemotaxis protein
MAGPAPATCLLVVEDDPAAGRLLAQALQEAGCEVAQAHDGEAALQLARALRPRLITLDLSLPGLHGREVLAALRSDPRTAGIRVVIISGYADALSQAERQGAVAIIRKPYDIGYVTRLIRRLVHDR